MSEKNRSSTCGCGNTQAHRVPPRGNSSDALAGLVSTRSDPSECNSVPALKAKKRRVVSTTSMPLAHSMASLPLAEPLTNRPPSLADNLTRSPPSPCADKLPLRIPFPLRSSAEGQAFEPFAFKTISHESEYNGGVYHGIRGRTDWLDPVTKLFIHIPKDDRKIVASQAAPYNLIVVLIGTPWNGKGLVFGTGAIIGPRHILTAAHVIYDPTHNYYLKDMQAISNKNVKFTIAQRYVNDCFIVHAPKGIIAPSQAFEFARYDYAVLTTNQDMVGPNDEVFNFNAPSDKNWLIGRTATTIGFPSPNRPCKADGNNILVDNLFKGLPFGKCDGFMTEQTGVLPKPGFTGSVIQHIFDTSPGQSGSPIFIDSGGKRTIYGIVSGGGDAVGNLAHRISENSYDYINYAISDSS